MNDAVDYEAVIADLERRRDEIAAAITALRALAGLLTPDVERSRQTGRLGGLARAAALSPERRAEIATTAARARWKYGNLPAEDDPPGEPQPEHQEVHRGAGRRPDQ